MLSENQIKRLLLQSENATKSGLHKNYNKGWVQALRLVLEKSTYPIRNTPLTPEEERPVDKDPVSNCCTAPFTYPGWPDSDLCSECYEHADIGEDE